MIVQRNLIFDTNQEMDFVADPSQEPGDLAPITAVFLAAACGEQQNLVITGLFVGRRWRLDRGPGLPLTLTRGQPAAAARSMTPGAEGTTAGADGVGDAMMVSAVASTAGAVSRASVLVRWTPEPYYALDCSVPSGPVIGRPLTRPFVVFLIWTEELAGRPWCRAGEAGPSLHRVGRGRQVLPGHCSRL
jgi:hypothetical protein